MMKQGETIQPPFRILPSRKRSISVPLALISIGALLFAAGMWGAVTERHYPGKRHDNAGAGWVLVVGLVLAAPSAFWFFRERRYFNPRNEYWIVVGVEEFALVTPDATDRSKWTDLGGFEVRQTTVHHRSKYKEHESILCEVVARYGGFEVKIPLSDFATGLGMDEPSRALTMCSILNELRQNALSRRPDSTSEPFHVPAGLVVAPMPPAKRKPFVVAKSVVQRS